jgi:hypothetical protein
MNDYPSRNEITPVDRSVTRAVAIAPVQPVATQRAPTDDSPRRISAPPPADLTDDGQLASAAEYASVHERIAGIMAELRASELQAANAIDGADAAIQAMLPMPIIVVPMPPASKEQMEQAARLARRIVEQASFAHGAQAHVRPGTVDQVLSARL